MLKSLSSEVVTSVAVHCNDNYLNNNATEI